MSTITDIEGYTKPGCNSIIKAFIGIRYDDGNYNYIYIYNGKKFNHKFLVNRDTYFQEKDRVLTLGWNEKLNNNQVKQIIGL